MVHNGCNHGDTRSDSIHGLFDTGPVALDWLDLCRSTRRAIALFGVGPGYRDYVWLLIHDSSVAEVDVQAAIHPTRPFRSPREIWSNDESLRAAKQFITATAKAGG